MITVLSPNAGRSNGIINLIAAWAGGSAAVSTFTYDRSKFVYMFHRCDGFMLGHWPILFVACRPHGSCSPAVSRLALFQATCTVVGDAAIAACLSLPLVEEGNRRRSMRGGWSGSHASLSASGTVREVPVWAPTKGLRNYYPAQGQQPEQLADLQVVSPKAAKLSS